MKGSKRDQTGPLSDPLKHVSFTRRSKTGPVESGASLKVGFLSPPKTYWHKDKARLIRNQQTKKIVA